MPAADPGSPHVLQLPSTLDSAATARDWVSTFLAGDINEQDMFTVHLVLTELVNNAVTYGGGRDVTIEITCAGGIVGITVRDHGELLPEIQNPAPETLHGRGLLIVDNVSEAWGAELEPGGKRVWARLRVGR